MQLRPAGRTVAWLERLAELDGAGEITAGGWLKPVAAARLTLDFPDQGHAAGLPPRAQRALARAILGASRRFDPDYVFVDEWDVAAPIESVFAALEDGRTYPSGGGPSTSPSRPMGRRASGTARPPASRAASPIT